MARLKAKNTKTESLYDDDITATDITGDKRALDVNIADADGLEVTLGDIDLNTDGLETKLDTIDSNTDRLTPLKADMSAATANTDVVTVSQAGIRYADLYNPSTSITMYVWFGADPAAAGQIVLPPLASYDTAVDNKSDMRYKSSVAGGQLIYVLRG